MYIGIFSRTMIHLYQSATNFITALIKISTNAKGIYLIIKCHWVFKTVSLVNAKRGHSIFLQYATDTYVYRSQITARNNNLIDKRNIEHNELSK